MIEFELNKYVSYYELCDMIGESPDMKHKSRHMKKISMQYGVEEKGGKYKIFEIYDRTQHINNMNYGKNKAFLEPIIYTILSDNKTNELRLTMPSLMELFMFVNSNYGNVIKDPQLSEYSIFGYEADNPNREWVSPSFVYETGGMFRRIIKDIFNDMQNKQLISVTEFEIYVDLQPFYEGGRRKYPHKFEPTPDQKEEYMEVVRNVLKEWGYEDVKKVPFKHKKMFDKECWQKAGLINVYKEYYLILNRKGIEEMVIKNDFVSFKNDFNKMIQDKVRSSRQGFLKQINTDDMEKCIEALIKTK